MTTSSAATRMNSTEKRAALALAAVFGLRMLGLFLILPVMAIYGVQYPDYAPWLVGLAIGAYGLTQALLQIPMGIVSDRIGRRPVIVAGLLIFAFGSVVAAMADTLVGVVIGRSLQGTGAIAAAVLALAADVSRDEHRPNVMATIGMCIGLAFALALVLGPVLAESVGLSGLFWFTAVAALAGIPALLLGLPKVITRAARREAVPVSTELSSLIQHPQLLRMNLGVFVLHCVLTAWFVVIPLQLLSTGLSTAQHAWIYLPTLALSIAVMVPMLIIAARSKQHVRLFRCGISLLIAAISIAIAVNALAPTTWWGIAVAMFVFFAGFNYLEATLPALLTRLAPAGSKGGASGIYSTFQFAGAFCGGLAGGYINQFFGGLGVGIFGLVLLVCWGLVTIGMQVVGQHKNLTFSVQLTEADAQAALLQLTALAGVEEVRIELADQKAYLKVDQDDFSEHSVIAVLAHYKTSV